MILFIFGNTSCFSYTSVNENRNESLIVDDEEYSTTTIGTTVGMRSDRELVESTTSEPDRVSKTEKNAIEIDARAFKELLVTEIRNLSMLLSIIRKEENLLLVELNGPLGFCATSAYTTEIVLLLLVITGFLMLLVPAVIRKVKKTILAYGKSKSTNRRICGSCSMPNDVVLGEVM